MARLRGETGGEGPSVSLEWAMAKVDMTRRDSSNKYGAALSGMNHFESTYHGRVATAAKPYCLFEYIKDSERVVMGRGRVNNANY
jgi:hypothetical protein